MLQIRIGLTSLLRDLDTICETLYPTSQRDKAEGMLCLKNVAESIRELPLDETERGRAAQRISDQIDNVTEEAKAELRGLLCAINYPGQ